jgi:hypothetical protein
MSTINKLLFFILLPLIGLLSFPPDFYAQGIVVLGVVAALIIVLGMIIWRGSQRALTFAIFLNGMNVIVRLMMLLSTVVNKQGQVNLPFGITGLLGLAVSFYLMLRLDQTDVRKYVDIQVLKTRKHAPAK